ncbi:protein kinase [Myxococcota bacterium]
MILTDSPKSFAHQAAATPCGLGPDLHIECSEVGAVMSPHQPRYVVIERIGTGGMGEVLLAREQGVEQVKRLVALKRIKADRGTCPGAAEAFRNEARVAARLTHPNIVQMYDFGADEGQLFIAMEYVAGRTVADILRRAHASGYQIPMEVVIAIAIDLARALHYAHSLRDEESQPLNIIHRDLSPSNVMVSLEGAAKILDFGLARASNVVGRDEKRYIIGKLGYMAPEQIKGDTLDLRADLFSLGVILWELTTRRRLFPGKNPSLAIATVDERKVPSIRPFRPDAPPGWEGVLRRALEPNPEDRYPSAHELQLDIEDIARFGGHIASNLPVVRTMAALFPEAAIVVAATDKSRRSPPRVLVVDDEENTLELFRRILRDTFEVKTAASVQEAMAVLDQEPFDVVVSDERMPGGRGVELLAYVAKTSPRSARLMVTAYPEHDVMLTAINQGNVHRFLLKPVRPDELRSAVRDVLAERNWAIFGEEMATNWESKADMQPASPPISLDELSATFDMLHRSLAPPLAIPWDALWPLASPWLQKVGAANLAVAVASRALTSEECDAIEGAVRQEVGDCWSHAEGHQMVLLMPRMDPDDAGRVGLLIRAATIGPEATDFQVAVGIADLAKGDHLRDCGGKAEENALVAWNKGPDHVVV